MKRYKIKVIKKYEFDLDGENKKDVRNTVNYILNDTKILDLPYTKKKVEIKLKKLKKRNNYDKKVH